MHNKAGSGNGLRDVKCLSPLHYTCYKRENMEKFPAEWRQGDKKSVMADL